MDGLIPLAGPFFWPQLVLLALLLVLGVPRLRRGGSGFPGLGGASVVTVIALGLVGTHQGMVQVFDAVAHASPEVKTTLFQGGMRVALTCLWISFGCAALVAVLNAAGWFVGGPGARRWGRSSTSAAVGGVALVASGLLTALCSQGHVLKGLLPAFVLAVAAGVAGLLGVMMALLAEAPDPTAAGVR